MLAQALLEATGSHRTPKTRHWLVGRPWMCLGAGTLLRVSHLPCPPGSCSLPAEAPVTTVKLAQGPQALFFALTEGRSHKHTHSLKLSPRNLS